MNARLTAFSHRGLAPHQFTPMSGAHQAASGNGAVASGCDALRRSRAVPDQRRLAMDPVRVQFKPHRVRGLSRLCLITVLALSSCLAAQAGLFSFIPKPMLQIPPELQGDYLLRLRVNPDNTRQQFTNAPPFATIFSNRVVFAEGQVRILDSLLRVRQKGTNVYMVSFKDKSSWLITPATFPPGLIVLEPKGQDSKHATIFFIELKPKPPIRSNVPSPEVSKGYERFPGALADPGAILGAGDARLRFPASPASGLRRA